MLGWALIFFLLAILSAYLGFFGLAGLAATIAKVLLVVFVILLIVARISGRGPGTSPCLGKARAKFFGTDLGVTHC